MIPAREQRDLETFETTTPCRARASASRASRVARDHEDGLNDASWVGTVFTVVVRDTAADTAIHTSEGC
jgi:hypothetical protein